MKHELKTAFPYFQDIWERKKTFEIRKNDRNFKVGDKLHLKEYNIHTYTYSGRYITAEILYVMGGQIYCKQGFVVIQLTKMINWYIKKSKKIPDNIDDNMELILDIFNQETGWKNDYMKLNQDKDFNDVDANILNIEGVLRVRISDILQGVKNE